MAGLVCDTDAGEEAGRGRETERERDRDNNKHTNFDFTIKNIIRRVLGCFYSSVVERHSCKLKVLVGGRPERPQGAASFAFPVEARHTGSEQTTMLQRACAALVAWIGAAREFLP